MKKIWLHEARSFEEAAKFDVIYYKRMSSAERLDTVQYLREMYYTLDWRVSRESRKGLRRVVRVIKRSQG